jgi:hypothetical protein
VAAGELGSATAGNSYIEDNIEKDYRTFTTGETFHIKT